MNCVIIGKPTNGSASRYFDDLDLVTNGRKIFSLVEFPTGHVAPNRLFKVRLQRLLLRAVQA